MTSPLPLLGVLILVGAFAIFVVFTLIYSSRYFVERRLAEWRRECEEELRRESVTTLRERIVKSDYWNLTEETPLRETETVREFFRRFDAEEYDEILADLDDGDFMCSVFYAAERSIGYRDRPMIMDYDALFVLVLKELRRRKRESLSPYR
jgi:hypothetical protein